MATFQYGETVICSIEVKDENGAYKDPITSMTITISDPHNGVEVSDADMVKDEIGKYHYDYQVSGMIGRYTVLYTAKDGTRISIQKDTFNLE